MNELLSDNLWSTIKRLARSSSSKRAAVAYVTSEDYVEFGNGDILVTDASNHAIASGQTNPQLLARAYKRGAELYSLPGLHSKVLQIGGTAVIGSANLSESSATSMIEAAWVTDNPAAVGMATSLINQLKEQAEPIDEAFLKRVGKIVVITRVRGRSKQAKPTQVRVAKHRTWIIGVHELVKEFTNEQEAIDEGTSKAEEKVSKSSSGVSWIRWTGSSRFKAEAKEGDTVIQIWSHNGSKRPFSVYRHAPILLRQEEDRCTRFFIEDFAKCEDTSISWSTFQKLTKQIGMPGKIGRSSARAIPEAYANALFSLWGE